MNGVPEACKMESLKPVKWSLRYLVTGVRLEVDWEEHD